MSSGWGTGYVEGRLEALQFGPEVNRQIGLAVFLLVEDGLAEEDADVKIFIDEEGLGDGRGVVEHGDGDGDFVVRRLLLFGRVLVLHFLLEEVEAGVDVVELLEE